jgi:tetratricopeptide (TPR) repeat protein
MSNLDRASMARLIRWLLIKNGFAEDQADAIIERLRSDIKEGTAQNRNDNEIRSAFSQKLARHITRFQLGDAASDHKFEDRYQHNYQILLQVLTQICPGIPFAVLGGGLVDRLFVESPNDSNTDPFLAKICYEIATVYRQQGALELAIAIELSPTHVGALNNRGLAYTLKHDYNRATRDFDQVIKIEPGSAQAYINRATAYWGQGLYAGSIKDTNKAIALDPNLPEAFEKRSQAKRMVGDIKGAESDAAKAKQLRSRDRNPPPARQ